MLKTLCNLAVALSVTTLALIAADPMEGTWKLNTAKSKYSPGPGPKSSIVTYSMDGDWLIIKAEAVSADGQSTTRNSRFRRDGKEYPYDGPFGKGTIAAKRTDDHHGSATIKYDDGSVVTTTNVLSKDGKTRTLTTVGKNGKGGPIKSTSVYERQ